MQINELCKKTGLTKKAIEYYQSKGLVNPKVLENGYRKFSYEDVKQVQEIATFRKLGLSVNDIKEILYSNQSNQLLSKIIGEKSIEQEMNIERLRLLNLLLDGEDLQQINKELVSLEKQINIKEKLLQAFPGFYGRYIMLHFGQYLNETIETYQQEESYRFIVDFLDEMDFPQIPDEIAKEIEEAAEFWTEDKLVELEKSKQAALADIEGFYNNNKEMLDEYSKFKSSDGYEESVAGQIQSVFKTFGETSGYYDQFIPAMRRLSPSYDIYYEKMLKANEEFIAKMPEIKEWY